MLFALGACVGDSSTVAPDDDQQTSGWESVAVTTDDGAVRIEKVSYRSNGLRVWGQICRPAAAGRHPVYIYTHGGFGGITDGLGMTWNGGACRDLAAEGWIVVVPAYRGEDGSEGRIEVCLGEVDDVLEMTRITLAQSYSDPSRVGVVGASHGGCVMLRALQRGLPAQIGVNIFGPADWASVYRYWEAQTSADDSSVEFLRDAIGGTPDEVPDAYRARSPLYFAKDLAAWPGSMLTVHGALDELVPVGDSCALTAAAGGFESYRVDASGAVVTAPPANCSSAITWHAGPLPATWPQRRYFVVYDVSGHGATVPIAPAMLQTAAEFLVAKRAGQ